MNVYDIQKVYTKRMQRTAQPWSIGRVSIKHTRKSIKAIRLATQPYRLQLS